MSKTAKIILIIILAVVIAAVLWFWISRKSSDNTLVGGDRDEHGCIGSAGYSWCAAKGECLRSWEENCPQ